VDAHKPSKDLAHTGITLVWRFLRSLCRLVGVKVPWAGSKKIGNRLEGRKAVGRRISRSPRIWNQSSHVRPLTGC